MPRIAITFAEHALPEEARQRLVEGLAGHTVAWAPSGTGWSNLTPAEAPHTHDVDVIFGQPAVADLDATRARWVQLTSAGYGRYDLERLAARGIALTTSSSVYAGPVAESALGMVLGAVRRLGHAQAAMADRAWDSAHHRHRAGRLTGATVVVLGMGAIAEAFLTLLAPFGCDVRVVRHRVRGDEAVATFAAGDRLLAAAGADVLVNLLPGTPATEGFVDAALLAALAPHAVVVNVGRGTTLDVGALRAALASGHLAGAWLDVTDPEPLPPDHPLWATPGVFVAPHIAGGQRGEHRSLVEHFLGNLARFEGGEALHDLR